MLPDEGAISLVGFDFSWETAEVNLTVSVIYASPPSPLFKEGASQFVGAFRAMQIPRILRVSGFAKISQAVIRWIAIDVIHDVRPTLVDQHKRDARCG
jgi:hypothetical protein